MTEEEKKKYIKIIENEAKSWRHKYWIKVLEDNQRKKREKSNENNR